MLEAGMIAVICLLVVLGVWRGWKKGLVRELISLAAFVAALAVAALFREPVQEIFRRLFPHAPNVEPVGGFLLTFVLTYLIILLIGVLLNMVDKLPIIHEINHLAGAVVGLIKSALLIWLLLLALSLFSRTGWGADAMKAIMGNPLLCFIYENNLLSNWLFPLLIDWVKTQILPA